MAKTAAKPNLKKARNGRAPRASKDNRNNVVSFRLKDGQYDNLTDLFENDAVVGVNSCKQMARKIVCDYLAGRLVYKNKADKTRDLESVPDSAT